MYCKTGTMDKNGGKRQPKNASGVMGLSFCEQWGTWRVRIAFNKKEYFLGFRKNKGDAIALRERANNAIAPIREELLRISRLENTAESHAKWEETAARGNQILLELKQQIRDEHMQRR